MSQHRDDDHRKQQIRSAALRCFIRRGFSATRLLDIARQANLSKGGTEGELHFKLTKML